MNPPTDRERPALTCPFCDGVAEVRDHRVHCPDCESFSGWRANTELAIAAWNTRASPKPAITQGGVDYWRKGHEIVEGRLAIAVAADPLDAPFPLVDRDAELWHRAQAEAYRDALEMMGVPATALERLAFNERPDLSTVVETRAFTDPTVESEEAVGFTQERLAGERGGEVVAWTAQRVKELAEDGAGFWRTCSGCHEGEDGHDVGHYPHSPVFDCKLGSGCRECGGLGAIWDDTDYDDMARFILGEEAAPQPLPVEVERIAREAFDAALRYALGDRFQTKDRLTLEQREQVFQAILTAHPALGGGGR